MSVTATEAEISVNEQQYGRIQYLLPDTSVDPWQCGYYAFPRPLEYAHETLPLHDIRPEMSSLSSPYTLEKKGFTAVKHQSELHTSPYGKDSFFDEELVRSVYVTEVEELVKKVTGAKSVFVISAAMRLREVLPNLKSAAEKALNPPTEPERCGIPLDVTTVDLTRPIVAGIKPEEKASPARAMHIDYSPAGARKMLRCCRADIIDEVGDIITAEDEALSRQGEYEGRRYAFFSVWRPLKTVQRDPIAVCDATTIDPERDLLEHVYKHPGVNGDFLTEVHMLQGKNSKTQKWYYIKNQQPDEVLFIQFFDSHASKEGRPVGTPHGSPELVDVEGEVRESCEVRVLALW